MEWKSNSPILTFFCLGNVPPTFLPHPSIRPLDYSGCVQPAKSSMKGLSKFAPLAIKTVAWKDKQISLRYRTSNILSLIRSQLISSNITGISSSSASSKNVKLLRTKNSEPLLYFCRYKSIITSRVKYCNK